MGKSWDLLRNKINELRQNRAVAEFARNVGVSRGTAETWIKGQSVPGIDKLDEIANALGAEVWELLRTDTATPREITREEALAVLAKPERMKLVPEPGPHEAVTEDEKSVLALFKGMDEVESAHYLRMLKGMRATQNSRPAKKKDQA